MYEPARPLAHIAWREETEKESARCHCWTEAVTGAMPSRSNSPVDRWTNAAGIGSRGVTAGAIPTKASQLLAPGVGTVGHTWGAGGGKGALLKMITALAPAWFAAETLS
jgi:hypothetical protein